MAVGALALVVPGAVAATPPEVIADALETQFAVNRSEMMGRALLENDLTSAQTLNAAAAQALLDRLFDLYEQRLTALRTYATALRAKVPAREAAGFVQTEFELLRLRDLQRDERLGRMR